MKAIPRIELCAGNKVKVAPPIRYIKYANGTLAQAQIAQNPNEQDQFYLGKLFVKWCFLIKNSWEPLKQLKIFENS